MARAALIKNSVFMLFGAALVVVLLQKPWTWPTSQAQPSADVMVIEAPETGRSGTEPLSLSEEKIAMTLVQQQLSESIASSSGNQKELDEASVNLNLVPLFAERHDESKAVYQRGGWQRRADVYVYDYTTNETVIGLVNLETTQVVNIRRTAQRDMPIRENELIRARQALWSSAESRSLLRNSYKTMTGSTLDSVADLELHALVVHDDIAVDNLAACRRERCAQLILSVPDYDIFPFIVYVNLSTQQVVTILQ